MSSVNQMRTRARRRRGRRVGMTFAVVLVLLGFLLGANHVSGAREGAECIRVVVQPGDTLWDIAARHASGRDLRRVVWEMRRLNALESVFIHPGQVLLVPVYGGKPVGA